MYPRLMHHICEITKTTRTMEKLQAAYTTIVIHPVTETTNRPFVLAHAFLASRPDLDVRRISSSANLALDSLGMLDLHCVSGGNISHRLLLIFSYS